MPRTVAPCVASHPRSPRAGVDIHGEDVLRDADLRSTMKEFSKWPTFPQLYVGGEFVGGCDIVTTMHQGGELKDLLAKVPRPTLA